MTQADISPSAITESLTYLIHSALELEGTTQMFPHQTAVVEGVKRYLKFFNYHYSHVLLPGVERSVPLGRIYIPIKFIDDRAIRSVDNPKTIKQLQRQRKSRSPEKQANSLRSSLDVVNQKQYLLISGEPGYGKSTFLRWLGQEACKGIHGDYRHLCFPLLIPLRYCTPNDLDLKQFLANPLERCHFPNAMALVDILLKQGKLLILLDGLDEVPTALFSQVQGAIESLVEQYPKNRYVLSCRKAALNFKLKRFSTVEIAPLRADQVATLLRKHLLIFLGVVPDLVTHLKNLMVGLGSPRLKDLTWNPLFLVMLCRVYSNTQQFPCNTSAVYREAVDLLLEAIEPTGSNLKLIQQVLLNAEVEKALLSDLAYQGLIDQQLIYPADSFENTINEFLSQTLSIQPQPSATTLLQRLQQQGLVVKVERNFPIDYYSFIHRTLQEYLTARYLAQYDTPIEEVVRQYATDLHWREVFLLLAAQVDRSDSLLSLLEQTAQAYVQGDRLQALLAWTQRITLGASSNVAPLVKRTIALAIALDRALDLTRSLVVDQALDRALNLTLDFACQLAPQMILALDRAIAVDLDAPPGAPGSIDLNPILGAAMDLKRLNVFPSSKIARLIAGLETLKSRLLDPPPQGRAPSLDMTSQVLQLWLDCLDLPVPLLQLTQEEAENLQNYLYICLLIEQCHRVAVRISHKTWDYLQNQMLAP